MNCENDTVTVLQRDGLRTDEAHEGIARAFDDFSLQIKRNRSKASKFQIKQGEKAEANCNTSARTVDL